MRDAHKPNSLKEYIKTYKESANELTSALTYAASERHPSIKRAIYSDHITSTIAHYSVGSDSEDVKASLAEAIEAFENGYEFDNGYGDYDNMIWPLCLGILCDIEIEDFKRITDILERDGANDRLLTEVIQYKQQDWETSNAPVIQEHPYASVSDIQNADEVQNYLDNVWYQGHSDAYWHDIHKNEDVNNYFGYWAWEVAALVKIRGIDDSNLKNQKYYPYDAVHWDEITPFGVIPKPI